MSNEPIVLGPGEGRQFWTSLSFGTVKVTSGLGDFSVFESGPPPDGNGPPPHVHHSYDEAWMVTEGGVDFAVDGHRERVGADRLSSSLGEPPIRSRVDERR